MNPRSGGKVTRFGLKDKAEALGAEVALLQGPGTVDVAALARKAVADGADLLGVVGGDGTQALVAGIAAEHGLPFLVISAGTRNHFALDLEDPATGPGPKPSPSAPSDRQPLAFSAPGRFWLRQATGKHRRRARARSKITEAGEADSMRSFGLCAGSHPRTAAPAPPRPSRRHRLRPADRKPDLAQVPLLSRRLAPGAPEGCDLRCRFSHPARRGRSASASASILARRV